MSDLAEFLTARLDEDEAAARESHYEGQRWITEEEDVYRYPRDEVVHFADRKADARHIARWDPARVLREVEAKRGILAEYQVVVSDAERIGDSSRRPRLYGQYDGLEHALTALAAVYSDHPEYDEAFRPA
jgi:hypothetical protein